MKPVVFIGQKGTTDSLVLALDEAFKTHELIKVKFVEFKEKDQKKEIVEFIETKSRCRLCGIIGHTAVFFRQNADPEKRKIDLSKIKGKDESR